MVIEAFWFKNGCNSKGNHKKGNVSKNIYQENRKNFREIIAKRLINYPGTSTEYYGFYFNSER